MQLASSTDLKRLGAREGPSLCLFDARELLSLPEVSPNLLAGDTSAKDAGGVEEFEFGIN
jgi:hypothetical protein